MSDLPGLFGTTAAVYTDDPNDEDLEKVRDVCLQFLRSGSTVTMGEWSHLNTVERTCLAAAGDQLRMEKIMAVAEYNAAALVTATTQAAPQSLLESLGEPNAEDREAHAALMHFLDGS